MKKLLVLAALAVIVSPGARAATTTVTLSVPGMTCPACPVTVKRALARIDGVTGIDVNFEKREAIVTFDDVKANVRMLTDATKNAGYPASPVAGAMQ